MFKWPYVQGGDNIKRKISTLHQVGQCVWKRENEIFCDHLPQELIQKSPRGSKRLNFLQNV